MDHRPGTRCARSPEHSPSKNPLWLILGDGAANKGVAEALTRAHWAGSCAKHTKGAIKGIPLSLVGPGFRCPQGAAQLMPPRVVQIVSRSDRGSGMLLFCAARRTRAICDGLVLMAVRPDCMILQVKSGLPASSPQIDMGLPARAAVRDSVCMRSHSTASVSKRI